MEFMNAKTYDVAPPSYYTVIKYKLAKKMTLYKNASRKRKITALKSGTQFTPLKIKPVHIDTRNGYSCADLYIKVKTKSGQIGWLFFPNTEGLQLLREVPMWG